jgi:hypothetical protein
LGKKKVEKDESTTTIERIEKQHLEGATLVE